MKKLFLMVVAAMMAIGASAQTTVKMIRVYEGNTVVYEQQYAAVDSVVFFDKIIPVETNGALPGEFSVSANQKVKFSKGNLRYLNSTWQFTENQWDRPYSNTTGVEVFTWGTGDDPAKTSSTADYSTFHDWGANPISNGGNEANMWRTLTADEWVYLFHGRTNASRLFGFGRVNGVEGVIILPDNWVTPEGASFTPNPLSWASVVDSRGDFSGYSGNTGCYDNNTYGETQWLTMQAHGAVFLPAANNYDYGVWFGSYWSATPYGSDYAYSLDFDKNYLYPHYLYIDSREDYSKRYGARAVRLVQDVAE